MNGLGLPGPEPTVRELRDQLALAEACEPIQQENADAKQAYRDALDGGDPAEIAAAKQRKQEAADAINETRTWLRREERIAVLARLIPRAEAELAAPHWKPRPDWTPEIHQERADLEARLNAMKEDLPALEAAARPLRELFGAFPAPGPAVAVEDGSVSVSTPAVRVKAKGN